MILAVIFGTNLFAPAKNTAILRYYPVGRHSPLLPPNSTRNPQQPLITAQKSTSPQRQAAFPTDISSRYTAAIRYLKKAQKIKLLTRPKTVTTSRLNSNPMLHIRSRLLTAKNAVQKDSNGKDLTVNVEIKVKQGFFDKLIAFFKGLFGLLPTVEIKP